MDVQPVGTLARSKTTINVSANTRERITGATTGADVSRPTSPRGNDPLAPTVLTRSQTALATSRPGLPIRALTVRKASIDDAAPPAPSPKPSEQTLCACHLIRAYLPDCPISAEASPGATEFFENLVDSYTQPSPPPKVPQINDRIANWARNNGGGPLSARTPPSAFGGSTRSGTIKRRVTRRTVATSAYDDDEEGYGSGEWDEMYELTKIRVKIHFDGDVRGMALDPSMSFGEFRQRVAVKFETSPQSIMLKFRDEDGGKVSMRDESDYELAIETARESAKGRPEGKLEVWCERK